MSLSDCQASTLMRRGVISETVYWLDPSREGGSLSTSSLSLSPSPAFTHPRPALHASSTRFTISYRRQKERWLADTSGIHDFQGPQTSGLPLSLSRRNSAIKSSTPEPSFHLFPLFFFFLFFSNFWLLSPTTVARTLERHLD